MAVLSERGQICELGERWYDLPPMINLNVSRAEYCEDVIVRRPVLRSTFPPVFDLYKSNASVGTDVRDQRTVDYS